MAKRRKTNRRSRNKKRNSAFGLLFLELIGVVAFAGLVMVARGEREAPPRVPGQVTAVASATPGGADQHRPQVTQIISDLWNAGF